MSETIQKDDKIAIGQRSPRCYQTGPCFAKLNKHCTILTTCYKKNQTCPFQKANRAWTGGKYYPYNPDGGTTRTIKRNTAEFDEEEETA